MLGDITTKNVALGVAVVATLVGIALYVVAVVLSSKAVKSLLVSIWTEATVRADRDSLQRRLQLARAMLSALYESDRGFSQTKFVLVTLMINGGAILGLLLNLGIESDQLAVRDVLSNHSYDGDDSVVEAFLGVLLGAPLFLASWMLFDFFAYWVTRWTLARAVQANSVLPVPFGVLIIVVVSYLLPFVAGVFFVESALGLFAAASPLVPLVASITSFTVCWQCSLLSLPAGLSVTLSTVLFGMAIGTLSGNRVLGMAARACEYLDGTNGVRLRNLALEVVTVSGGVIVLLTWKALPWNG